MKKSVFDMCSICNYLVLKRKDSSETFVSDDSSTAEKTKYDGERIASKSSEWHFQRRYLIALLSHIKVYDKELNLNYCNETIEKNSKDTINHLRSKIEMSPEIYQISDWNNAVTNKQKIINLQALFSETPTDNSSRYKALKITITSACWKQMRGTLQIAESIPEIGKTWLAPILVLLSKFPFFEASVHSITYNHSVAVKWTKKPSISIRKDMDPLRRKILDDPIIPICHKLKVFKWILNYRFDCNDFLFEKYKHSRDLLYKGLDNEIFIDDDKWNSHIQNFLPESWRILTYPGHGLSYY